MGLVLVPVVFAPFCLAGRIASSSGRALRLLLALRPYVLFIPSLRRVCSDSRKQIRPGGLCVVAKKGVSGE